MSLWLERAQDLLRQGRRSAVWRMVFVGMTVTAVVIGCRLTSNAVTTSPSFSIQNGALLEVTPLGTAREQAVESLTAAGVQGAFGVAESVYYCDVWNRDDGSTWRLDAALFFDQSGRLYKVGPSQPGSAGSNSATHANDVAERPNESMADSANARRRLSSDRSRRARSAENDQTR